MLRHDAKLEMIIIMTTRNVMGKCQAEMCPHYAQMYMNYTIELLTILTWLPSERH